MVLVLVSSEPTDGVSYDTALVSFTNALFAHAPFAKFQTSLFDDHLPETVISAAIVMAWAAGAIGRFDGDAVRRRVILAVAALVPTYFISRELQHLGHHPRPATMLPLLPLTDAATWTKFTHNLTTLGSFPSDHAALSAIAVAFAFSLAARPGWFFLIFSLYANLYRVAAGYHWPSDVAGGAIVGTAVAWFALFFEPMFSRVLGQVLAFSRSHSALFTGLAFVLLSEMGIGFGRLEKLVSDLGHGQLFH